MSSKIFYCTKVVAYGILCIITKLEFFQHHFSKMGHGNTSCDPHLHLNHQATNAALPHAKRPPPGGYVLTRLPEKWVLPPDQLARCPGYPAQRDLIKAIQAERQFPRVAIFHIHGRAIDRDRRELLPVAASLGSSRTVEDANRWREQCAFTIGHADAPYIAIWRGPVFQRVRLVGKIGSQMCFGT